MRWLVVCVLLVACARDDRAEQSAKTVAKAAVQRSPSPSAAALALEPQGCAKEHRCGAATADAPVWATVPPGSHWTELRVTGMHCGGCARRIEGALAKVDGVLGVEIDVPAGSVKVATAAGADARSLAAPSIDALGYHVQ
jgi:copper chaperone CopZ